MSFLYISVITGVNAVINTFLAVDKVKTRVLEIMNAIACVWIFILTFLITIDVGGRVFFNTPFKGTPELVSNSIIAITFLEIPYVLYRGNHTRSNMLISRMSATPRFILELAACFLGILMMAFLIKSSWPAFVTAVKIGEFEGEGALRVPTYPTRGIIIFGAAMMIVEYVFQFIKRIMIKAGKIDASYVNEGDE